MSVVCPAERHIPVEFTDIYGIIKGTMSLGQRQRFEEMCQLIESLYSQEFMSLRRNLKKNFKPFSVGAKGQKLQTRLGKPLPPSADLDQRELKLVEDFIQLMVRARFHVLDKKEWDMAKQENFMFRLPVAVNWAYFDRRLLQSFWSSSTDLRRVRMLLPEMADCCLVFHRGLTVMEDRGRYFNDKLDLLLSYTVVWLAKKVWVWLVALAGRLSRLLRKQPAVVQAVGAAAEQGGAAYPQPSVTHHNTRVVERKSLSRLLPTVWSLLLGFPRSLTIQEPAYKEVVILYRAASKPKKKTSTKASKRAKDDRLCDILSRRNIHIKCFHEIPMADIDAIFPEKKVYLKTLSIITMIISAVTAMFAALSMVFQSGTVIDIGVVGSAVSLVAARCFQVYSSMQAERSEMVQSMTNILYEKTDDAQEGVVSMLLEDMAEQQLKECVIAYIILYMGGQETWITSDDLDRRCEEFLDEHFGLKLDFAVEDSLKRLDEWGLVKWRKGTPDVVWTATPLETAHGLLIERWSRAYEALGKPDKKVKLPLTSLFAEPNVQLPSLKTMRGTMASGASITNVNEALAEVAKEAAEVAAHDAAATAGAVPAAPAGTTQSAMGAAIMPAAAPPPSPPPPPPPAASSRALGDAPASVSSSAKSPGFWSKAFKRKPKAQQVASA